VIHHAAPDFWSRYYALPPEVRDIADRAFAPLKDDPHHPSLHLKKLDDMWSVRVGAHYRALAVSVRDGLLWYWIGSHAEYDRLTR
jgi:hypothetical protein